MSDSETGPIVFKKKKVKSLRQRKRSCDNDSEDEETKNIRYVI